MKLRLGRMCAHSRKCVSFACWIAIAGSTCFEACEANPLEHGCHAHTPHRARDAARREAEGEVPGDVEMRPEREILEYDAEAAALRRQEDAARLARDSAVDVDRSREPPRRGRVLEFIPG